MSFYIRYLGLLHFLRRLRWYSWLRLVLRLFQNLLSLDFHMSPDEIRLWILFHTRIYLEVSRNIFTLLKLLLMTRCPYVFPQAEREDWFCRYEIKIFPRGRLAKGEMVTCKHTQIISTWNYLNILIFSVDLNFREEEEEEEFQCKSVSFQVRYTESNSRDQNKSRSPSRYLVNFTRDH